MEVLRKAEIEALVPGQYILVKYGNGPKGLMATDVKRIDSGARLQSNASESQMVLHEDSLQEAPEPTEQPELTDQPESSVLTPESGE